MTWRRLMQATLAVLFVWTTPAIAANESLVVMLSPREVGAQTADAVGAGIIVADDGRTVTIVTARHVVEEARNYAGGAPLEIIVEFFDDPGAKASAKIVYEGADDLDLMVLQAPSSPKVKAAFEKSRESLTPARIGVALEDEVFAIGYPDRRAWFGNRTPNRLLNLQAPGDASRLEYQSTETVNGMSGGGLFSEHGALLAMVLDVGPTSAQALNIEVIRKLLADKRIPFALSERSQVAASVARKILASGGGGEEGLKSELLKPSPDFNRLHLFWIAGVASDQSERALRSLTDNREATVAQTIFTAKWGSCVMPDPGEDRPSAAQRANTVVQYSLADPALKPAATGCPEQFALWLDRMIAKGLNPDLTVNTPGQGEESLLTLALHSKNSGLIRDLLTAGATPNPYIALNGQSGSSSSFVTPLEYLAASFTGAELDTLWAAFTKAGVVTVQAVRSADGRAYSITPLEAPSVDQTLCRRASERYKFDWCAFAKGIPVSVRMDVPFGMDSFAVTMGPVINIQKDRLFVLGRSSSGIAVVEIPNNPSPWNATFYGGNYGCIKLPSGNAPQYCWRTYDAYATTYQAGQSRDEDQASKAIAAIDIANLEIDGISLRTPLTEAITHLEHKGYVLKTRGDPTKNPNSLLTFRFSTNPGQGPGNASVTLLSLGGHLLAIAKGQNRVPCSERTWLRANSGRTADPTNHEDFATRSMQARVRLSNSKDTGLRSESSLVRTSAAGGIRFGLVQRQHCDGTSEATILDLAFRRNAKEGAAEFSLMDGFLREFLGGELRKDGECIDPYWRLRGTAAGVCPTPRERDDAFMAKNGARQSVVTLPDGLQYEVVARGGASAAKGRKLKVRYIDPDRAETYDIDPAQAGGPIIRAIVPKMPLNSRWRIYVPPQYEENPVGRFSDRAYTVELEVLGYSQ